jgi:predicted signal transduction protein with EAL and GGDEF domain
LLTLSTRQTIGFEALVRWRHPDFGIVMLDRFIGTAAVAYHDGMPDRSGLSLQSFHAGQQSCGMD